jgi:hypothetical protein
MKRYISVAAWIALSMLTNAPAFAATDAPADPAPVDAQQGQGGQTATGIAQTPSAAVTWQAKELARYANQKRAAERRQLELSKGDAPPTAPATTTVTARKRSSTKRIGRTNR